MRTGRKVGGIVFDPQSWNIDNGKEEFLAILCDECGRNESEHSTLAEAQQAAIRKHGVDVLFVQDGPFTFDLVIETA